MSRIPLEQFRFNRCDQLSDWQVFPNTFDGDLL